MWLYIIPGFLVVFIVFFVIAFVVTKKTNASFLLDEEIFKQNMRKAQLIDVRTKNEYNSGHINGAKNIQVNMMMKEMQKLRKDQPIYLYCESGKRSSRAAMYLKSKGFNEVYELRNGLKGWNGPLK